MAYQSIIFEKSEGIAVITLNRPEKLNALDHTLLQDIARAVDEVAADDEVKAVIMTGTGRAFCSGADLTGTVRGTDPRQPGIGRPARLEPLVAFGWAMRKLRNLVKPTIGAINGVVAGGGLGMACTLDIRIASEQARFSSIFVRRGLVPDCGVSYFLPRLVGTAKALEMMWTGDLIDATEAERIGLVSRVVPHDNLMKVCRDFAMRLVKGPSVSIELTKRMVYDGLEANNYSSQLAYESWAQSMANQTDDVAEGRRSFVEKREPVFKGM
jgi:2-(1,2-epoxy-1,2-dihydrophenyl)acetyl-CoA isomerase